MIAVSILVSFSLVLYARQILLIGGRPLFSRGNREINPNSLFLSPLLDLKHKFRTTNLDLERDLFSLLKIVILHISLVGIASVNSSNVVNFSHIFILLYLCFLLIDLYQYQFVFKGEKYSSKNLIVAVVMLACVATSLSLILKVGDSNLGVTNKTLISFYCMVVLLLGLGIRDSLISDVGNSNFYQNLELEFARFSWLAIFIALFNPTDLDRFTLGSSFVIKILFLEMIYQLMKNYIPKLNTKIRWQLIFKFVLPITLISVFGIFVSVSYVNG